MISDPLFYAAAIPAVVLIGLSKGGFGGAIAMLGVPLMTLVIPPVQAAAIMLPILIAMDIVGLIAWRGIYDRRALAILVPAGIAGIAIGWATATFVTDAHVRLIVGLVAFAFALDYYRGGTKSRTAAGHNPVKGSLWGTVAGFTSFVSHAGGPPFQMYMLPLRLAPPLLAGTAIIFFAVTNVLKLPPYFLLGQFSAENLATSAVLLPLALVATTAGVFLVRWVRPEAFYRISYAALFLVSLKLIWDGTRGVTGL